MEEPLEQYLDTFEDHRAAVEELLEMTVDLAVLRESAVNILSRKDLLDVTRYLPSPPISADDLKVLADASLTPSVLKENPDMAQRIIETILTGLDRNRFPWVGEDRDPDENERELATVSTAALIASRRVMTNRANESKMAQEEAARARLRRDDFDPVNVATIPGPGDLLKPGMFTASECLFGSRKADVVVGLWDRRNMPLECKVSNSSTNSVKRLNNDAAVKADTWRREFGDRGVVPSAVLAGVFKRHNLEVAQRAGLTIFWRTTWMPWQTSSRGPGSERRTHASDIRGVAGRWGGPHQAKAVGRTKARGHALGGPPAQLQQYRPVQGAGGTAAGGDS